MVGGLYRYVRNPMYVAVDATIVGQALLLGQSILLVYAGLFLAGSRLRPALRRADPAAALREGVRRVPARRPRLVAAAAEAHHAVGSRSPGDSSVAPRV